MDRLTIAFTDGAAKGNPGPGGWGAIVVTADGMVTELGGGSPHTTNNKMELSGAIAALEHVAAQPGPVAIYTDSTYVIQGITQWVWGWRKRNWKTATGGDDNSCCTKRHSILETEREGAGSTGGSIVQCHEHDGSCKCMILKRCGRIATFAALHLQ